MKVYHIDQFKCPFCTSWFDPYSSKLIPMRLSCGHSICKGCLSITKNEGPLKIICPEDLEVNVYKSIESVPVNMHIKELLEKILGENRRQESDDFLEVVKDYSKKFEKKKEEMNLDISNIFVFIDKLFQEQIRRIESIWQKLKSQFSRPINLINDWKENVKNYLKQIRNQRSLNEIYNIEHYVGQARKVELEINNFLHIDKNMLMQRLIRYKSDGFKNNLSLSDLQESPILAKNYPVDSSKSMTRVNNSSDLPIIQSISVKAPSMRNSLSQLIYSQSINGANTTDSKTKRSSFRPEDKRSYFINSQHQLAALLLKHKVGQLKTSPQNKQNNQYHPLLNKFQKYSPQNHIYQANEQMLISQNKIQQTQNNFTCLTLPNKYQNNMTQTMSSNQIISALKQPQTKLINFNKSKPLKQKSQNPLQVIRKTNYDCEKYLKDYATKIRINNIQQALEHTIIKQNQIQYNHQIDELDFLAYLQLLTLPEHVEIMKLIKINLQDQDFNIILNFCLKNPKINTLVLSHNKITEQSLDMLTEFLKVSDQLKNVYLANNHINAIKAKTTLGELKRSKLNIYI